MQSFLHPQKKSAMELSKAYWKLKKIEDYHDIACSIVANTNHTDYFRR